MSLDKRYLPDTKNNTTLGVGRMNHCSSICPHNGGVIICFYSGTRECNPDQATQLIYYKDGEYSDPFSLEAGTGNCVIWSIGEEAVLLYSVFEKYIPDRPVLQWIHCSNWLSRVKFENEEFKLSEPKKLGIDPEIGCLGRCQPIQFEDELLLPMYREHDCHSIIMASKDGWNWEERGKIGVDGDGRSRGRFGNGILIQSTLWHDGERLYSLSRDITKKMRAWFSYSDDKGKNWSDPTSSSLVNRNNSVVAIHDGTAEPLVIWNNQESRVYLTLGKINLDEDKSGINKYAEYITRINELRPTSMGGSSASYPNYCFDESGDLHMIHTDSPLIRHHICDSAEVAEFHRIGDTEYTSSSSFDDLKD